MSDANRMDGQAALLLWKALAKALMDKGVLTFDETHAVIHAADDAIPPDHPDRAALSERVISAHFGVIS